MSSIARKRLYDLFLWCQYYWRRLRWCVQKKLVSEHDYLSPGETTYNSEGWVYSVGPKYHGRHNRLDAFYIWFVLWYRKRRGWPKVWWVRENKASYDRVWKCKHCDGVELLTGKELKERAKRVQGNEIEL